jgi:hypothetical protein
MTGLLIKGRRLDRDTPIINAFALWGKMARFWMARTGLSRQTASEDIALGETAASRQLAHGISCGST